MLITTIIIILSLCVSIAYLSDPPTDILRIICFIFFIFFQIFFILRIFKKRNNEISVVNKELNFTQNPVEHLAKHNEVYNIANEHTDDKTTPKSFALLDGFLKFLIIIIIFSIIIHLSLQCRLNEKVRARRINNPLFKYSDVEKP